MKDQWRKFTALIRIARAMTQHQKTLTGVLPAPKVKYVDIPPPDAIAKLCQPTGDEDLDNLNMILIDLIQRGLLKAVHAEHEETFRYLATEAGHKYVEEHLGIAVEKFLQGIFGDN